MLRIDKPGKALVALHRKTMRESGYWERRDIQEMIRRSPIPFFQELEEPMHLVGSEVQPAEFVQDRIDLLGIDPEGAVVIMEIKRDNNKLQLLQALSYAGMIAKWEPKRFIDQLSILRRDKQRTLDQAKEELEEFLEEGDVEAINRTQRIILLAEAFDYEVLVTAEWLTERYDLDIRCYRVALTHHNGDDFLTVTRAYPPPELTDLAIRRRRRKEIGVVESTSWDEALASVTNPAVVKFFQQELAAGRSNSAKRKTLRFPVGGRIRFRMWARKQHALVYQYGRFEGDTDFWTSHFAGRSEIGPIGGGGKLRFSLFDESDFNKFKTAISTELANTDFSEGFEDDADEADQAPR